MGVEIYLAFANYNRKMNRKLYTLASGLSPEQRREDKGAFFKSVEGTLQHILVADLIWLGRFRKQASFDKDIGDLSGYPPIETLDQQLFPVFDELWEKRKDMDERLLRFVQALTTENLEDTFQYKTFAGKEMGGPLWVYVSHLFNHQTHHRGQATTLLTQMGYDVGVTDFPHVLREEF